ncbi:MAG: DNA mismatch repair protein MutS [Flavobacteriaceae bacterium]|nr:DNA mismatch repair protein MutS [Flavobacteriaceae bacterium]
MSVPFVKGMPVEAIDQDVAGKVVEVRRDGSVVVETPEGFEINFLPNELIPLMDRASYRQKIVQKGIEIKPETTKNSLKRAVRKKGKIPPMEVDLHIDKLVKSYKGMSNYDILTLQVETAKRQLEFALQKRIPEVVFIHGLGQGVLRSELEFLFGRYENISFSDADYTKYGLGALAVYIGQKAFTA